MTVRTGAGIPRLQELAFLWLAHLAVADGASFEDIRQRLIAHMHEQRDKDVASGNTAKFQLARQQRYRYVSNVTEALKELMRLGLVERAALPSEGRAAPHYASATFEPTDAGRAWAVLLHTNRRAALDELLQTLWRVHPQLAGYLAVMAGGGLVVPLAAWTEFDTRSRTDYIAGLAAKAANAATRASVGWNASEDAIRGAITEYVDARLKSAFDRNRTDPFPRNQDFVRACEEAMVKLAFAQAGESIDYISHEVLRRWMRTLSVASFSYHVPGPSALRLWPTADFSRRGDGLEVVRHIGDEYSNRIVAGLGEAYEEVRRADRTLSPWVPIYRIRAAICFRLRVSDGVFDRSLVELLRGERGEGLPYRVNVDPAMYGSVPPSERPLRVETRRGPRDVYTMTLVSRINQGDQG